MQHGKVKVKKTSSLHLVLFIQHCKMKVKISIAIYAA